MLWEAHVTVEDKEVKRWCEFCAELNGWLLPEVKPLYIELTEGAYPKQLMFAARWESSNETGFNWLATLTHDIKDAGFTILREKLECPLDKSHEIKTQASNNPYSECHMKLMLPSNALDLVEIACSRANVHASRNLLADQDGLQKWYLTQRAYGSKMHAAAASFNDALSLVREITPTVRMEMEYVIYDSNPGLDKGWA